MRRIVLSLLLAVAVTASASLADELRIDGTSKESFANSTAKMAEDLGPEEKELFQKGLLNLIITRYPPAQGAEGFALLAFMPQAVEVAHTTMNGVTRTEILARGRELASRPDQKTGRIKPDFSRMRACLQRNVTVSNARIETSSFGHNIKLDVTNRLPWVISFVHIGYKVITPGRSVPWSDEDFGMSISGGIEPGETRSISTNAFGIPDIAKDLETSAQVLDVADADKRHLVGEQRFMGNADEPSILGCT